MDDIGILRCSVLLSPSSLIASSQYHLSPAESQPFLLSLVHVDSRYSPYDSNFMSQAFIVLENDLRLLYTLERHIFC